MSFLDREDVDGIRLSWNHVPKSKLQHQRNVVPLTALYTPYNNKSEIPVYPESALLTCRQCKAFAHPFVNVTQQGNGAWECRFCLFQNGLPVSQDGLQYPALQANNTTIEYVTNRRAQLGPIFLYVVDTCFEGEDIEEAYAALCESITYSVALLPSDAMVGFISFGRNVLLHDYLAPHHSIVFNGNKLYKLEEIQTYLGLNNTSNNNNGGLGVIGSKYLNRVDLVEYQIGTIVDLLVNNTFPHVESDRPMRATGCAMKIATLTLQALLGRGIAAGGHVLCFAGGAVTYGPGKIVDVPKKEPLRSHHDIEKAKAAQLPNLSGGVAKVNPLLWTEAKKFYNDIATTLTSIGISMNLFIGSYDQAGLHEMSVVCSRTGGSVVLCDSFSTTLFKQSLIKFFERNETSQENDAPSENDDDSFLQMAFGATLECRTSNDLQIQGLIGHASALPVRDDKFAKACLSPIVIGEGNTNAWKLCSVNPQSTYAIYLDKLDTSAPGYTFIQFTFHYQHPNGEYRIRVTTVPITVIHDTDSQALLNGFDSEAALVAIARAQIEKLHAPGKSIWTLTFDSSDINKHLDKILIDYCTQFANYRKGDLSSFSIFGQYFDLAGKIYHLRRSPFIRVFNSSPDETSFYHHVLMHEDTYNSTIMIKPTLLSYDIDTFGTPDEEGNEFVDPVAVELDSSSLGDKKILLLDSFFQILIYHGKTVAAWRKENYQNMPEYSLFKRFLQAPKMEALIILADRFPLPRFIDCDAGGSQARFLIARLNSSTKYSSNPDFNGSNILTDDASLAEFMDQLKRRIVG